MKVLFLCSGGKSCRSLVAKAILQSFDKSMEVYSASTLPSTCPDQLLLEVMAEIGMELSGQVQSTPEHFKGIELDYLITLCDGTKEEFAKLPLHYKYKLHLGFVDPEKSIGLHETKLDAYRYLRDEIKTELDYFYHRILKNKLAN